ncbi:2-hydroxy-6-oxononadienedioate/2-hydroxy-6-oxononatrienedioate hydrolase 2 [Rhynchospora pubera]|uniref:2-hydroxy-6-oxononadienedioate/2-hydroxy-6-oxononatrienedioate hydrolase 2 n=1 Tax=Rhynchospora pubera TaxID=906938 RepID=A0AAV8EPC6_9POAL|nr:2-hydroxy-6-oxononadienedioate/2-hydroxy-6-oxononatrienedioate hydrolase 2 [Rhynchospora pubera]
MALTGSRTQPFFFSQISQKFIKDCNLHRNKTVFFSTKPFSNNHEARTASTQKLKGRNKASVFLAKTASVGSAGEYSEPLSGDAKSTQKRRRTIAGVDQEELLHPGQLADPDSLFCEFNGVHIHHKIGHHHEQSEVETSEKDMRKVGLPMVLLHGFGASGFSWEKVMKPLANLTGSKVLAFDRPAFGLTSRVKEFMGLKVNPYSMGFSVLATLSFIDLLGSEKAILMGHSAGSLVAVSTYFEAPEKVAALILVAPAIIAPLISKKVTKEGDIKSDPVIPKNPFVRVWRAFLEFFKRAASAVVGMFKKMGDMIGSAYKRALAAVLRSALAVMLIRMIIDKFGIPAVRNAWCNPNQVADDVLQGYTKPLKVKDWEIALLEYCIAMITDSTSKPSLSERLSEISCPVLIVTGDKDRLVPTWNAERLSKAIPSSRFEMIKDCGHLPHEERVEEFLSIVERFIQSVFMVQSAAAV